MLLGLLCSYNKFEMKNIFQRRLSDLVDQNAMQRILATIGTALLHGCEDYILIQDDASSSNFQKAFNLVGLSLSRKSTPSAQHSPADADVAFSQLLVLSLLLSSST
jgi:hypothetical protein